MYEHADHLKCKHCGSSNCLFKLRVNHHEKRKTGKIIYVITPVCKICYREICRLKNERWFGKKKNRDKANARAREIRRGNPKYQEAARRSYQKHREARLKQKRDKHVKVDPLKDKRRKFSLIGKIREGVW